MKDHQLKVFLRIADEGSIRGAARALNLSQSALTRAMRELEANVGAELLIRSYRGVEFTPAGKALLTRARLVMSTLEKARDEIRWLSGGAGTQVSVAVTSAIAATVLPNVLRTFDQEQPDTRVILAESMLSTVLPGLMEGRIDFAVAVAETSQLPYEITLEPLAELLSAPLGRVGHPLLQASSWSELAEARWVLNLAAGSSAHYLKSWLNNRSIEMSERIVCCDSSTLMVELMRHTDMIGLAPRFFADNSLSGKGLACFDKLNDFPRFTVGLLKLKGVPLHPGAERLATLFRREISGLSL
ncbi:LysR substrate-binding domain-containing protein [Cobetia crustatorum]|uniref:LysR family transcriptional regulator n=1 Tax=Cobetia crustatorum TaxID=553385 RepID=A0A558HI57_9GAMM|nr:LysR substrate-binding domain-containing protein [Cobetia crustatorum]TVU68781.1 LysR family transcriptional regulator [Cobetia crustatorum]